MVFNPYEFMYPGGFTPDSGPSPDTIEAKRQELDRLRVMAIKAREIINSPSWPAQVETWQEQVRRIIHQFNPQSPTALSDAVHFMGMLRQIYINMDGPQQVIDRYEKKKATYDRLVKKEPTQNAGRLNV